MSEAFDALGRLIPSLALIVGGLLLVRRWAQRGGRGGSEPGVRVLARSGVTRGAVVAVVTVDSRRFLVGAADQHVALLAELDPDPSITVLPDGSTTGGPALPVPAARGQHAHAAMDLATAPSTDRPRMGLINRLQRMTVRTHPDALR